MGQVRWMQVEPTTRCNLKCSFCYGRYMKIENMNLQVFREILDMFPAVRLLHLQGEGEPLLNTDFYDMAAVASKKQILTMTTTNGSLLSQQNVERILEAHIACLFVSIESADPVQFRALRGIELERILDGIERILVERDRRKAQTPTIGFAVTAMKRTMDHLPGIFELHKSLGMDGFINVRYLQSTSSYLQVYSPEIQAELLNEKEKNELAILERHLQEAYFGGWIPRANVLRTELQRLCNEIMADADGCYWLEGGLFVDADGTLAPCCNIKKDLYRLGHYRMTSQATIEDRRQAMQDQLRHGTIPTVCDGCRIAENLRR